MRACSIVIALSLTAATQTLPARDSLSQAELKEVKRICGSLLGRQYLSEPWKRLKPYLRDEHAIESTMVCSASCGGGIALRGALFISCLFPNPMKAETGIPWGPRDALVYSISISDGKRVIFHRETKPKLPPIPPPW